MTNAEKYKTAEERARAFESTCFKTRQMKQCEDALSCTECKFAWLDQETDAEKPLPCPFCGDEVETAETLVGKKGFSCSCGYTSKAEFGWDAAIAAHNRVARAVMEAGKKEVTP